MPFGTRKSGDKWEVVNQDTDKVFGSHDSEAEAQEQVKAMYANDAAGDTEKVVTSVEPVSDLTEEASKPEPLLKDDTPIDAADVPGVNLVPADTGSWKCPVCGAAATGQDCVCGYSKNPHHEDVASAQMPNMEPLDKVEHFLPLTKIDEAQHRVWAVGAKEEPDSNHEIFDFETSAPRIQKWSEAAFKRSNGLSYGNVRSMHALIAAGRLFMLSLNRANKSIDLGIEVVDPVEWEKVRKGVYTGISIGGSYAQKWPDPTHYGFTRYTAEPTEFSFVDVPCAPSAVIQVVKIDGHVTQRSLGKERILANEMAKDGTADLRKQLPTSPAASGEVSVPDEHVQRVPAPFTTMELSSNAVPSGAVLEGHHPATNIISDVAAAAMQATPSKGVVKVANINTLKKQDSASAVDTARSIMSTLLEQAKSEEIDMDTLTQLAAALDVSLDEADSSPANTGSAEGSSQSTEDVTKSSDVSTPSTPSESSSTPSTPSTPTPSSSGSTPSSTIPESTLTKGANMTQPNQPLSTTPPIPNLILHSDEENDMARDLPEFIDAMDRGKLAKAQKIAGGQIQFDRMVLASCVAIMNQYGVNKNSLGKLHAGAPESLDLQKALVASDVPGVWLMKLARLMLPLYAGVRRRLPTQNPQMGSNQATWRAMLGFSNVVFANMMSTAEAAIGDAMNESFLTFNAPYRDMAQNDAVTLKAIAASRGYDDPMQIAVIRTLTALLQGEERKLIGDNYAALASVGTVTAVGATGGVLPAATYTISISALTYRGWLNGSTAGGVGETAVTAATPVVISGSPSQAIAVTWAAVPNAWAYNVYSYNGSTTHFIAKVTVNKYTLLSHGSTVAVAPVANNSANAYGFEGLGGWCQLSTVYGQAITGKVGPYDLAGAGFTAANGGIPEIDTVLESLWTTWQIAPTVMLVSSKGIQAITGKLLSLNSASLYRIEVQEERGTIRGGAFVTGYTNKFAAFADGTPRYIDIIPHPYMPDGTALVLCESINYPMARESRGFSLDILVPYTYFPLAQSTIQYPFALTLSETLECYHPSVQVAIQGIDWTL